MLAFGLPLASGSLFSSAAKALLEFRLINCSYMSTSLRTMFTQVVAVCSLNNDKQDITL